MLQNDLQSLISAQRVQVAQLSLSSIESRNKICRPDLERQASTQVPVTRSTDLKYVIPEKDNGNSNMHIGSHRPQADGSSPTPPSGLSQRASGSCRPSLVLTLFLSALVMLSSLMPSAWMSSLCRTVAMPIVAER